MSDNLQDTYGPETICFGCGPANDKGLQIKSVVGDGEVVADFEPLPEHQAFPGVVNGGIIGALFDCHMNWTAAHAIMTAGGFDRPPVTVTADFHVRLRRPTPYPTTLHLSARVTALDGSRAQIAAEMTAGGTITATCTANFVAVEEGHPAYHRWQGTPSGCSPFPASGDEATLVDRALTEHEGRSLVVETSDGGRRALFWWLVL